MVQCGHLHADAAVGPAVTACWLQDQAAAAAAAGSGGSGPMFMVIETQGSNEQHDKEKLEAFLEVSGVEVELGQGGMVIGRVGCLRSEGGWL